MEIVLKSSSNRGTEWINFSKKVLSHIDDEYTLSQYGDANWENPELGDIMQRASLSDIQQNMRRYVERMGTNARGEIEARRDLLKLAHYASAIDGKYERGEIQSNHQKTIEISSSLDDETKKRIEILIKECLYGDSKIKILM